MVFGHQSCQGDSLLCVVQIIQISHFHWYLQINFQHIMCQVHLDQEWFVSGSLNLAPFVGGSTDFFEIAPKIVVFGFVAVGAFDVVDDDTWYWWWYFWCCRCCCWHKFIIVSGCFALRVDNELVSVFWVSRSDWIILSFDFSSFSRDAMLCWRRSVLSKLLSIFAIAFFVAFKVNQMRNQFISQHTH